MSFCCGSRSSRLPRQLADFSAQSPPDLDEFQLNHDGRLDPRLADKLSKLMGSSAIDRDR